MNPVMVNGAYRMVLLFCKLSCLLRICPPNPEMFVKNELDIPVRKLSSPVGASLHTHKFASWSSTTTTISIFITGKHACSFFVCTFFHVIYFSFYFYQNRIDYKPWGLVDEYGSVISSLTKILHTAPLWAMSSLVDLVVSVSHARWRHCGNSFIFHDDCSSASFFVIQISRRIGI